MGDALHPSYDLHLGHHDTYNSHETFNSNSESNTIGGALNLNSSHFHGGLGVDHTFGQQGGNPFHSTDTNIYADVNLNDHLTVGGSYGHTFGQGGFHDNHANFHLTYTP